MKMFGEEKRKKIYHIYGAVVSLNMLLTPMMLVQLNNLSAGLEIAQKQI